MLPDNIAAIRLQQDSWRVKHARLPELSLPPDLFRNRIPKTDPAAEATKYKY